MRACLYCVQAADVETAAGEAGAHPGANHHYIFLQNGAWGSAVDMQNIAKALRAAGAIAVLSRESEGLHTGDGIQAGGFRLSQLIQRTVSPGATISLIGHSLGGCYARSALRYLEEEKFFENNDIYCDAFITLATPHLGIFEMSPMLRAVLHMPLPASLSTSPADLLAADGVLQNELVDEIALASLRRFASRTVYANADRDFLVKPCTALLVDKVPNDTILLAEKSLTHPVEVHWQTPVEDWDLSMYRHEHHHAAVQRSLQALTELDWKRFLVDFSNDFPLLPGQAHVEIINHGSMDRQGKGHFVVEHLVALWGRRDSEIVTYV